jgi:hypothetical protein
MFSLHSHFESEGFRSRISPSTTINQMNITMSANAVLRPTVANAIASTAAPALSTDVRIVTTISAVQNEASAPSVVPLRNTAGRRAFLSGDPSPYELS